MFEKTKNNDYDAIKTTKANEITKPNWRTKSHG